MEKSETKINRDKLILSESDSPDTVINRDFVMEDAASENPEPEIETEPETNSHDAELCRVNMSASGKKVNGGGILKAVTALGAMLLIAMAVNHNIHAAASDEELFIREYMSGNTENTTEDK